MDRNEEKIKLTLFDREVFEIFVRPGEVVEVRILGAYGNSVAWGNGFAKGIVSGYFDNHEAFVKAVALADKGAHQIYFTLQVIDPRLIARSFNRLKPSDQTTSDSDVLAYRWIAIDIDPVRPAGIPSSDKELEEALELLEEVASYATSELKLPTPLRAVSGNGGHLLFPLREDLPADQETREVIRDILAIDFAERFDTETVKIDTSVYNPARIWKLYGTTARKGDIVPAGPNREARPHRASYIYDLGDLKNDGRAV